MRVFIKRTFSVFIVIFMALGILPPFNAVKVSAALPSEGRVLLGAYMTRSNNPANLVPSAVLDDTYNTDPLKRNTAMTAELTMNRSDRDYYMIFPIDDGKVVRATFVRNVGAGVDEMTVDYNLFPSIAQAQDILAGVPLPPTSYTVWSPLANDAGGGWLAPGHADVQGALPDGMVIPDAPATVNPYAVIQDGQGFSFRYDNFTSHILWDGETISLSTDGLMEGRVYSVYFGAMNPLRTIDTFEYRNDIADNPVLIRYGFNGIDMESFESEPYAQDVTNTHSADHATYEYGDPSDVRWYGKDSDHMLLHYDSNDISYMDVIDNDPDDPLPGHSAMKNRIEISFDLPVTWNEDDGDGGVNSFSRWAYEVDNNNEFDMLINFALDDGPNSEFDPEQNVRINEVVRNAKDNSVGIPGDLPTRDAHTVTFNGVGSRSSLRSDPNDAENVAAEYFYVDENTIRFTLDDLPAGTIFNKSMLTLTGMSSNTVTNTNTASAAPQPLADYEPNEYAIYTYAEYEGPYYVNGGYHMLITPYKYYLSDQALTGSYGVIDYSLPVGNAWTNDLNSFPALPPGGESMRTIQYNGSQGQIMLPVPAADINMDDVTNAIYERIFFQPSGSTYILEQQKLRLRPTIGDVKIGQARNFHHRVPPEMIPTPVGSAEEIPFPYSDVLLYLGWDVAAIETVHNLLEFKAGAGNSSEITVIYDMNYNEQPETDSSRPYGKVIVTFNYTKDPVTGVSHVTTEIEPYYDGSYDEEDFEMIKGKVDVVGQSEWYKDAAGLYVNLTAADGTVSRVDVSDNTPIKVEGDFRVSAEREGMPPEYQLDNPFLYPNIYFLNLGAKGTDVNPGYSNIIDLPLGDYSEVDVPVPENFDFLESNWLTEGKPTSAYFKFTAPYRRLLEFVDQQKGLDPTLLGPPATSAIATFSLVISEDQDKLLKFSEDMKARTDPFSLELSVPYKLYTSRAPSDTVFDITQVYSLEEPGRNVLDDLRNGEIIVIVDFPAFTDDIYMEGYGKENADGRLMNLLGGDNVNFPSDDGYYEIIGLDRNQKYSAAMYSAVTFRYSDYYVPADGKTVVKEAFSDLTGIIVITTGDETMPADPDEKAPGTPHFEDPASEAFNVKIYWPPVSPEEGYNIDYEIVRTRVPIEDEILNRTEDNYREFFDGYVNKDDQSRTGFAWRDRGQLTEQYDWYSSSWGAAPYTGISVQEDGRFMIDDDFVAPNSLYYYYIRAVKLLDGNEVDRSPWTGISVTTLLIEGPTNLRVLTRGYEYDPLSEAVIEFDVKLPNRDYILELSIREGTGEWSEPIEMTEFLEQYTSELGIDWTHFVYKISGLNASMDYMFRVRIKVGANDGTMQDSQWSDTAYTRTEFDQQDYDDMHDTGSWLDFLKRELEDKVNSAAWPLIETIRQAELFVRPSMLGTLMLSADSQILLYDQPVDFLTVYFPSEAIKMANQMNMSFIIRNGMLETVIPPYALGDTVDGVTMALEDIKNGDASDYYVKMNLSYNRIAMSVDQYDVAERTCTIRAEAVSVTENAARLDTAIINMVNSGLADDNFYAEAESIISDMIEEERDNMEIAAFVHSFVRTSLSDLMGEAADDLESTVNRIRLINAYDAPFLHSLLNEDTQAVIKGYINAMGTFTAAETMGYKGGQALRLFGPVEALFTIHDGMTDIPGLTEAVEYPGGMAEIIAKYGLSDILGGTDLERTANVSDSMSLIARISGADIGSDGVAWMRDMGYSLVGKAPSSSLFAQEAAYLAVALYEMKTGTSVNNMQVRNYNATAGITGIDGKYLRSVQAAFELGILTDQAMNPLDPVSISGFLDMLSRLNYAVGL